MLQYKRDYSLYIGYGGTNQGILVKGLQLQFEVNKVIGNQNRLNESIIKVYNLTQEQSSALQDYQVSIRLLVGYEGTGLKELCLGNSTKVQTEKSGPDRITTITVGEAFSLLNNASVFGTIPAGKTVGDAIKEIAGQAGLTIGTLAGEAVNTKVLWGMPLEGTPKQQLDEIAASYRLDYSVNGNKLSVRDAGGFLKKNKDTAYVLNEETGILDIPYFESWNEGKKKKDKTRVDGVFIKALLNPDILPGDLVHLKRSASQEGEIKNGFYVVRTAKYSGDFEGNNWEMEMKCDNVLLGDFDG